MNCCDQNDIGCWIEFLPYLTSNEQLEVIVVMDKQFIITPRHSIAKWRAASVFADLCFHQETDGELRQAWHTQDMNKISDRADTLVWELKIVICQKTKINQ